MINDNLEEKAKEMSYFITIGNEMFVVCDKHKDRMRKELLSNYVISEEGIIFNTRNTCDWCK